MLRDLQTSPAELTVSGCRTIEILLIPYLARASDADSAVSHVTGVVTLCPISDQSFAVTCRAAAEAPHKPPTFLGPTDLCSTSTWIQSRGTLLFKLRD